MSGSKQQHDVIDLRQCSSAAGAKSAADKATSAVAGAASLASTASAPVAADTRIGREFALLICSTCHVVTPDQDFAPTRVPAGPAFHDIANWPTTTDKTLHDFLVKPHGKMPDLRLPDYQVTALVDYMLSLRDRR